MEESFVPKTKRLESGYYFEGAGAPIEEDARAKAAKEVEEYYNHYLGALQDVFSRTTRHWKIYMSSMKDNRSAHEKWRSTVHVPYAYSGVETAVSTMLDLFFSQNPPFKPEAQGEGFEEVAYKIERWLDFVFRQIRFKREIDLATREMLVQGLAIRKNIFIRKEREIFVQPSIEQAEQFDGELRKAVIEFGLDPPRPEQFEEIEDFYEAFEKFRQAANSGGSRIPELPRVGPRRIINYKGPGWKRISYYSFFYDPLVAVHDQEVVIQRSIVPLKWIKSRAGKGDEFPFDPEAVEECSIGDKGDGQRLNQWQEELAQICGVSSGQNLDSPQFKQSAEILESYHIGDKLPYRITMNRTKCINKRKDIPWEHGSHPFTILQNVELPFSASSFGDIYQSEGLYKEMNTLRGLRVDAVKISTLPIFAKMKETGMTEMAKRIAPGIIFDTPRGPASIGQVSNVQVPSEAFKELYEIKDDIDTTNATQPLVRGQVGPSKITATHAERAREGAALRTKQRMFRFEDDMGTTLEQFLSLGHQFYDQEEMNEMGGRIGINPIHEKFKKEDFLQALLMEYAFRAATTSINRELDLQQKKDLFITFVNAQVERFKPHVMARRLLASVDQTMDDVWMTEEEFQQFQQAQAEAQAQAQGQEPEKGPAPGTFTP